MRKELTPEEFQQKLREAKTYYQIRRRLDFLEKYKKSFKLKKNSIFEHKIFGHGRLLKSRGMIAVVLFNESKRRKIDIGFCFEKGIIKSNDEKFNRTCIRYTKFKRYYEKLLIRKAVTSIRFKIPVMVFMYMLSEALNKGKAA